VLDRGGATPGGQRPSGGCEAATIAQLPYGYRPWGGDTDTSGQYVAGAGNTQATGKNGQDTEQAAESRSVSRRRQLPSRFARKAGAGAVICANFSGSNWLKGWTGRYAK